MKGFRSVAMFQGYSVGAAEMRITPNGKSVTSFTIGVGGNRDKGIKGVMIRCHAWEANAQTVLDAVTESGLAVSVSGRLAQKVNASKGKQYINNDLNLDVLLVQLKKSDTEVTAVELVRSPAAAAKAGGNGEGGVDLMGEAVEIVAAAKVSSKKK